MAKGLKIPLYFHMWLLTSTLFGILLRFCEIRKKKFYIHLHPLYLLNSLKKKKISLALKYSTWNRIWTLHDIPETYQKEECQKKLKMVKEITEVFDCHPKDSNSSLKGKCSSIPQASCTWYQGMLKILVEWQNYTESGQVVLIDSRTFPLYVHNKTAL